MAYWRPLRGLLGAGEGGRSWPSRSSPDSLPERALIFLFVGVFAVVELESDIFGRTFRAVGLARRLANLRLGCSGTYEMSWLEREKLSCDVWR